MSAARLKPKDHPLDYASVPAAEGPGEAAGASPGGFEALRVVRAAYLVRCAVEGRMVKPSRVAEWRDPQEAHCWRACALFRANWTIRQFTCALSWALVLLTLVEQPAWCAARRERCGFGREAWVYPSSGISVLEPRWALGISGILWSALALECVLEGAASASMYWAVGVGVVSSAWLMRTVIVTLMLGDMAWAANGGISLTHVTAALRCAVVLGHHRALRLKIFLLVSLASDVLTILTLLGGFVGMYAWLGTLLWNPSSPEGLHVFPTFYEAYWNLLVAVTTANFPDIMMRAYDARRTSAIFFVAFIIVCMLLVNALLAVVADSAARSFKHQEAQWDLARQRNLEGAFALLSCVDPDEAEARVTMDRIHRLFDQMSCMAEFARLGEAAHRALVVDALDVEGLGRSLGREDFLAVVDALKLLATPRRAVVRAPRPGTARHAVAHLVHATHFERFMDGVLIANVVWEAACVDDHQVPKRGLTDALGEWPRPDLAPLAFAAVYFVELVLRSIAAGGLFNYVTATSARSTFDGTLTLLLLVLIAVVYVPNGFDNTEIVRYALVTVTLRLLRTLGKFSTPFRRTGHNLIRIMPKAASLLLALVWLAFIFASIGVGLFGGKIALEGPLHERVVIFAPDFDTAADVGYYDNSFNDMASAMVTLFELAVVNNWNVIVEAYVAVTTPWARIFFVGWWIVAVLVFLNVIIAAIITSFMSHYEIARARSGSVDSYETPWPPPAFDLPDHPAALVQPKGHVRRHTTGDLGSLRVKPTDQTAQHHQTNPGTRKNNNDTIDESNSNDDIARPPSL